MYQPFAQSMSQPSLDLSDVNENAWQQHLLEAANMEAELTADSVVAHVNAATTDFVLNCSESIKQSLNAQGLDLSGGMLVNAASALLSQLGHPMNQVLAGESFGSEADRMNTTILAGEAFDIKQKAKEAYEWIKKMLAKAKAWVLKLFDGATSLAKDFGALKADAQKRIQAGKSAENGAKFKLSKAQQKQLTIEGNASKLATTGANLNALVKSQQTLVDLVFDTNFTKIKARVTQFEELIGTINAESLKADKADAMRTELEKANLFKTYAADTKQVANSMVLAIKGTTNTAFDAAATPAIVLREANTQFENTVYRLSAHADAKNLKFTDGKEFPILGLDEIVTLCDTAIPALEAIARAKDSFNKGMAIEKTLDSAVKAIGNLGEEGNAVAPALLSIAGKLGTALRDPVGPFSATFVAALGAVHGVAKSSASAYTK